MLIFLDFDGVLRPLSADPSRLDPDCLGMFETALSTIGNYRIVITSTWRLVYSLPALRKHFSVSVADNIIGVTPEVWGEAPYPRHAEILAFLDDQHLTDEGWLAIDDDPSLYPRHTSLLVTDPEYGFDIRAAEKLNLMSGRL